VNLKYPLYKEIYLRAYLLKTQLNYFLLGVAPFLLLGFITHMSFFFYLPLLTLIISILDVRSRYIDFLKIRKSINEKNYMKYVRSMHFSPCRRNVVAAAYGDIRFIKNIYHKMGYRWYHLTVDNLHQRILSTHYWKAALFRRNK
jgi:hypothetical protein